MKYLLYPGFTFFYILLCLVVISAGHLELAWTYYLTKPLVLLSLLVFFGIHSGQVPNKLFRNLVLGGLFLSMIGDFLLMFAPESNNYFIAGLVSFLFAHACYTAGFILQIFRNRNWNQHWGQLAFSALLVVYGAEFFILNRHDFGNLVVPVLFYCIAITSMGVAAVMRDRIKYLNGYARVVTGAVFFIISDSLLAYDKFVKPIDSSGFLILGTYFFAQYLIATGVLIDLKVAVMQKQKALELQD